MEILAFPEELIKFCFLTGSQLTHLFDQEDKEASIMCSSFMRSSTATSTMISKQKREKIQGDKTCAEVLRPLKMTER